MSQFFASGGQSIGVSASASVLLMNIQDLFPFGLSPAHNLRANHSVIILPLQYFLYFTCFPDSSVAKESTCNEGDLGSIPGLGRSPGEGKGYPLQYSGLENSMNSPWGCKESDMTERLSLSLYFTYKKLMNSSLYLE